MPGLDCMNADTVRLSADGELLQDIEREYGIIISKAVPADKNGFILYSAGSTCYLKKSHEDETSIMFFTGLYNYILNRGFKNILRLYRTKQDRPYVCRPDGIYLLYDFLNNSNCGFTFKRDGGSMIKLLSDFHKYSSGYTPPSGGKVKSCWGRWVEEYRKELNSLKKYRDEVKSTGGSTPFEIMFLSDCDIFISRLEDSIHLLKSSGYLENVELSMQEYQVCMDSFKQSNFYDAGKGMCIRSLNKCRYDIVEKDLAELMGKLAEPCSDSDIVKLAALVGQYSSIRGLRPNSICIIRAFLLFPDEYLKICSRYFKGSDKWSEGEYMDKLRNASYVDGRKAKLAGTLK